MVLTVCPLEPTFIVAASALAAANSIAAIKTAINSDSNAVATLRFVMFVKITSSIAPVRRCRKGQKIFPQLVCNRERKICAKKRTLPQGKVPLILKYDYSSSTPTATGEQILADNFFASKRLQRSRAKDISLTGMNKLPPLPVKLSGKTLSWQKRAMRR